MTNTVTSGREWRESRLSLTRESCTIREDPNLADPKEANATLSRDYHAQRLSWLHGTRQPRLGRPWPLERLIMQVPSTVLLV